MYDPNLEPRSEGQIIRDLARQIAAQQAAVREACEIMADLLDHRMLPVWNDRKARAFLELHSPEKGKGGSE